jgi:CRP-like cAMP-binding protein
MEMSEYLIDSVELIEKMRSIPILNAFDDEDLRGLIKLSRMHRYKPGERIMEEGQYDNWIYFLISGQVGIEKQGKIINTLKRRGDLFGEMGIIDGSPRSASIRALSETACLAMDASYIDRLEGHEKMAFTAILYRLISEILAKRLRDADQKLLKAREEIDALKKQRQ